MTAIMKTFARKCSVDSDLESGLSDESEAGQRRGSRLLGGSCPLVRVAARGRRNRREETLARDLRHSPEDSDSEEDRGTPSSTHSLGLQRRQGSNTKVAMSAPGVADQPDNSLATKECELDFGRKKFLRRQSSVRGPDPNASQPGCTRDSSLLGQVPRMDDQSHLDMDRSMSLNKDGVKSKHFDQSNLDMDRSMSLNRDEVKSKHFANCDTLISHVVQQSTVLDVKKELLHKLLGDMEGSSPGKREEETRFIWKFQDVLLRQAWTSFESELGCWQQEMDELSKSLEDAETRSRLIQAQSMREVAVLRDQLRKVPDGTSEAFDTSWCIMSESLVDEATQGLVHSMVSSTFKQVCADAANGHSSELYGMVREFLSDERKAIEQLVEDTRNQTNSQLEDLRKRHADERARWEERLRSQVDKARQEAHADALKQAGKPASSEDPFGLWGEWAPSEDLEKSPEEERGALDLGLACDEMEHCQDEAENIDERVDVDDIHAIDMTGIAHANDIANQDDTKPTTSLLQEAVTVIQTASQDSTNNLLQEAVTAIQSASQVRSHSSEGSSPSRRASTAFGRAGVDPLDVMSLPQTPAYPHGSRTRQSGLDAFQVAVAELAASTGCGHPSSSSRSPFRASDDLESGKQEHRPILPGASAATLLNRTATLHEKFLDAPGDAVDIAVELLLSLQPFHGQLDAEILQEAGALYHDGLDGIAVQMLIGRIRGGRVECESLRSLCIFLLQTIKDVRTARQARELCNDIGPGGRTQGSQISKVFSAARSSYAHVQIENSRSPFKLGSADLSMTLQFARGSIDVHMTPQFSLASVDAPMTPQFSGGSVDVSTTPQFARMPLAETPEVSELLPVGSRLVAQMKRIHEGHVPGWQDHDTAGLSQDESANDVSNQMERPGTSPSSNRRILTKSTTLTRVVSIDSEIQSLAANDVSNLRIGMTLEAPESPSRKPGTAGEADRCVCGNIFMSDSVFCRQCGAKRPQAQSPRRRRTPCLASVPPFGNGSVVMDKNFAALPSLHVNAPMAMHVDDHHQHGRTLYKQSTPRTPKGQLNSTTASIAPSRAPSCTPSRAPSRRTSVCHPIVPNNTKHISNPYVPVPNSAKQNVAKVLEKCMAIRGSMDVQPTGSLGVRHSGSLAAVDTKESRPPVVADNDRAPSETPTILPLPTVRRGKADRYQTH